MSFLTDDEKRAAIGYGPKGEVGLVPQAADALLLTEKYSPDQPRVPAGSSDGGQWTDTGGSGGRAVGGDEDRLAMGKLISKIPSLFKPLIKPKPKPPSFLTKRPGKGSISGKVDDLQPAERNFAEELKDLGHDVEIIPSGVGRTADFKINGTSYELKTVSGVKNTTSDGISRAISSRVMDSRGQAANIIVDARNQTGMSREISDRAASRAFGADVKMAIKEIIIYTSDGPFHYIRMP